MKASESFFAVSGCACRLNLEFDQSGLESVLLSGQLIVAGDRDPAPSTLSLLVLLNPRHILGADDHCLNIGRCATDLDRQNLGSSAFGLGATLADAFWVTVLLMATRASATTTAPSILVLGVGMGTRFMAIYDVALGDINPAEAGAPAAR